MVGVRPENREDADDPAFVEPLNDATGIFMTGGNQLKLAGVVTGTAFGRAVTAAHAARCRGRRYVGRREHPGRAHDRVRPLRRRPRGSG